MKLNTFLGLTAAAAFFGLASMGGSAVAQTPDGEPPANEGVCDILQTPGTTPGLYGLCVAYCEAQDVDSVDKEPPSTKILGNYNKRKQETDPAMPCVKIPCSCWTEAEIASISGDGISAACNSTATSTQIIDVAPRTHSALAETAVGRERCRYVDLNTVPTTIRSLTITPAEAVSCRADVVAACASTGK